ncbi:hypothetical protein C347_06772 [Cryptococcus neoformans AD2-60a]|uniref:Secreted protein n=1 Tax=Cryptococcus neoformans (strain H99 / ATCC 208821 / CBS 10515 / FGSC 9487) TaxID=235443 RepID=T2BQ28_CRYN9|nr:hypothetical protein CNAG_08024 [Cryptococcus neoformans var. grubii H99]AGV14861.1 hypothetical protein CNAG_08024 [Cryptococcus neoformans var. grubii H99]AUB29064.1 hypothetical protein CKF44_08024 [Cryptococcus neoformans var. grubii]OWZ26378.1 hypothetical protein C347_06772 [Cryptococcus neoformans var. grubii AD2-60a]OXC81062.1 hypothetical protein C344_06747 [Cryptococcus neoformans var. grubii AD1-7a]|eukprot:XP_012053946.1 hypothetical protein CNAG_08024 [Cryptococcus neoformans var. grubii H99]
MTKWLELWILVCTACSTGAYGSSLLGRGPQTEGIYYRQLDVEIQARFYRMAYQRILSCSTIIDQTTLHQQSPSFLPFPVFCTIAYHTPHTIPITSPTGAL